MVLITMFPREIPRLTGSADVIVAEVLSQFRLVVGFRANAVAPHDEKIADNNIVSEHLSPLLRWSLSHVVSTTHVQ